MPRRFHPSLKKHRRAIRHGNHSNQARQRCIYCVPYREGTRHARGIAHLLLCTSSNRPERIGWPLTNRGQRGRERKRGNLVSSRSRIPARPVHLGPSSLTTRLQISSPSVCGIFSGPRRKPAAAVAARMKTAVVLPLRLRLRLRLRAPCAGLSSISSPSPTPTLPTARRFPLAPVSRFSVVRSYASAPSGQFSSLGSAALSPPYKERGSRRARRFRLKQKAHVSVSRNKPPPLPLRSRRRPPFCAAPSSLSPSACPLAPSASP